MFSVWRMTVVINKMNNDLILISISDSFPSTGSRQVAIPGLKTLDRRLSSSCSVKYQGYRSKQLDIEFSNLFSTAVKIKEENDEILPTIFFKPNLTANSQSVVMMTPTKLNHVWSWKASFKCYSAARLCKTVCPTNHCTSASHPNFEILINLHSCSSLREGERNVLNHLSWLLEDQTLSDVTFQVQGETIKAHTIIISAGSPVLSAMFTQDFIERKTKVVTIQDTKPQVFKQLLHYLYTGKAPDLEKEDVSHDLLITADKYGVDLLKEECAEVLIKRLDVNNAIQTLILAHLHSAPKLLQSTLSYMSHNGKAICSRSHEWIPLMINYPDLCYLATKHIVGF